MRTLIVLLASVLSGCMARAQYTIDWAHPAADMYKTGTMAARDTSDNLIVTGYRPSYIGAAHMYTQKYDKHGVLLWERIDSTGSHVRFELPTWVNTDAQNGIYVTGFSYVGTSTIYADTVLVLKYSALGTLLWKRKFPRGLTIGMRQVRSELDAGGNLYVGTIGSSPGGFSLIKLDASGNTVFDVSDMSTAGSIFNSMRVRNGRVVLVASGQNNTLAHAVSWTTAGAFLWGTTTTGFGGIDVELDDAGNSYLLTTYANQVSATSSQDIVIKKLGPSGTVIAQYNYDFGGYEAATHVTLVNGRLTVIGTSIAQGSAYMDWVTFQVNTAGAQYWNVRYDQTPYNDEKPGWVVAKVNGDVFVTGQGGPLYQGQYLQYVTLKYSNGVQQWAHTDPYYGYNGVACVLAKDSSLYVLGRSAMVAVHYLDDPANTVKVDVKLLLEGPFDGVSLMSDALRAANLLPTTEPYSGLGFTLVGGAGESAAPAVFTVVGANAIVDWVLVELRNASTPSQITATRCGLLQRDGDVVGLDGVNALVIAAAPGNYHVAVRHRNHLGAMTSTALPLSGTTTTIDLRAAATGTWGTEARKTMNANRVLWSGDVTSNGQLKYTGTGNDRDPILVNVGSTTPNNVVLNTYSARDVNMNGQVKYTGTGNDRDPILVNVGSTTPNSVRTQQLP